ncbi:MAG: transposase [Gammaproteobacteria bacterium]|nr:transposase [Gammaproteobacteria bacterium]
MFFCSGKRFSVLKCRGGKPFERSQPKAAWMMPQAIRGGTEKLRELGSSLVLSRLMKLNMRSGLLGKTMVVEIKERGGGVRAEHVSATTAITSLGGLLIDVDTGSSVYADDHKGNRRIDVFFNQGTVKHSVDEYVEHNAHTSTIESFWTMMKRFLRAFTSIFHLNTCTAMCMSLSDWTISAGLIPSSRL